MIGVDSHLIAGELFAGSGADTVLVGGSLGGTIELAAGADSLTGADAKGATLLGGTENAPSTSLVTLEIRALLVVLALTASS